jgi:hypothetical protein
MSESDDALCELHEAWSDANALRELHEALRNSAQPPELTESRFEELMQLYDPTGKVYDNRKSGGSQSQNEPVPELMALKDAQWQPIKDSLAGVGKDADQLTAPTIKGEPLLRKALPWIANEYVLEARLKKQAPTLKQAAAELQATLKTATALLERLSDPSNHDWLVPDFRIMLFDESKAHAELLTPLKEFIAVLDYRLEVLACLSVALDNPSKTNARKVHNRFWRELTYLWQSFDPDAGRLKRRHLQRFLFACSKPFFPGVTDPQIASFVDHYYSRPKRVAQKARRKHRKSYEERCEEMVRRFCGRPKTAI